MSSPSDADLRRIFERSPIGIYRSTADGRFVFVNRALVTMLGYESADEVLALDLAFELYVRPEAREALVDRYLSAGVLDGVDVEWRRRDGTPLHVRLFGHAVADAGGVTGFDVQVIDVTALRAAEAQVHGQRAELDQALTKLQAVMGQMPVMVWTTDRGLRLTSIEGTAYPARRLLGASVVTVVGGDERHPGVIGHRRALQGGSESFEAELDQKLWLITVAPMRDADGRIVGVIGSAIDVTTVRRLERNLQQTQRIESLGVLAGGVAHDFNNLLVAILGNADRALRDGIAEPMVRQAVAAIRTAAIRAAELTSHLLAYSGNGELEAEAVDVTPLVEEMVGLLATGRTGEVRLELAGGLPGVRADAAQVRQVVMNLVTNAFEALGPDGGEVRVRTRAVEVDGEPLPVDVVTAPPGRYVVVEVRDTGAGMDAATRRKIFDPFFTTKPSGHGLGLAAVLGIVRSHRGGLRLSSRRGKGTVFEVLLPACDDLAVPVERPARADRSGKTVMVVDDEDVVRDVLCHMIEDLGYRAIGAAGGGEALTMIERAEAVDLAIVDLTMPRMNGRAVVEGLRTRRPALPVILTSGFDRDRATAADAAGFLSKPFRFETLERLLADVLGPAEA